VPTPLRKEVVSDVHLTVRLTPYEHASLGALAQEQGLCASDYIRARLDLEPLRGRRSRLRELRRAQEALPPFLPPRLS